MISLSLCGWRLTVRWEWSSRQRYWLDWATGYSVEMYQ